MVAETVTPMGVIGGRYGLVSVQVEDFLRTFANSIFNNLLLPLFALVVGIIALFTNTSNHKTRKAIIIGLIVFQVSAFVLTIVDNIEK